MTKLATLLRPIYNSLPILPRALLLAFGLVLIIFIPVYFFQPLAGYWNAQVVHLLIALTAATPAILGLGWVMSFEQGEPPRRIWMAFLAACIVWMVGEFLTILYTFFYPTPADFTWMDPFWITGYFLFSLALYYQYTLLFERRKGRWIYLGILSLLLVISVSLTILAHRTGFAEADLPPWVLFIAISYPLTDIVLGISSLGLLLLFRQGQLALPWRGLVAFALGDTLNIVLWIGGQRFLDKTLADFLYLVSDVFYILGYMLIAWGFLTLLRMVYPGTTGMPKQEG